MFYYEVLVASPRYHGKEPLTYDYDQPLEPGQIVVVPMQKQNIMGVVASRVSQKPSFKTKPIVKTIGARQLPMQTLRILDWLKETYPAPLGSLMQLMIPSGLLQSSRTQYQPPAGKTMSPPPLTKEQAKIINEINSLPAQSIMLHGDTGTGKTRVYAELIKHQLDNGKSSLVLTPEIGLTPQLALTLEQSFGPSVVVLHSNLTPADRRNRWLFVLESDKPLVVVGPRSTLFAPVNNLGLVIVDEAHDSAYKQEQQPYYQATHLAAKLAQLSRAKAVFGTATPQVADYYVFSKRGLPIIRMNTPAIEHSFNSKVETVDLSDRSQFNRSPQLSDTMIENITRTLKNNEQALVFLNRRGTARLILCESCGWSANCKNCDLSLTYHGDRHTMSCHVCGYSQSAPSQCPECGHTDIAFRSVGTKTIVQELEKLFPDALVRRFDTDLKKADRLEENYADIRDGKVDILVGTQMLAKGLDLPKLALIGIINADTGLLIPDFTAEERTYQLLTQVIGRVGRGHRAGLVIIQTHHPDHPTIASAIERSYSGFYERQLGEREVFGFPPFVYLLKLTISRGRPDAAEKASRVVVRKLHSLRLPIEINGPSPSFYEKTHGKYHWQIIIKSKDRRHLLKVIAELPANTSYDIDPVTLI